jgi:hypothetical protein
MNEILYHTLRNYRLNQLTGEEKLAFEQQLATDPAFAAEAAEYATILEAIQKEGDFQLDARLTRYAKELLKAETQPVTLYSSNAQKQTARRRRMFYYAAAAVFLLLVVALTMFDPYRFTPEEVFVDNFSARSLSRDTRDVAKEPWLDDYESGNYDKVISDLNILLADPTFQQPSAAYLYIGASNLAKGRPEEALTALNQVSRDSYDWETAEWFTAMALLKMGKTEDAKKIIDDVVQKNGHPFQEEAKKVSEDL